MSYPHDAMQPDVEPSAEIRAMAKKLREVYLALVRERFTSEEALAIIGHAIQGGSK